jgi:hypothetical protein
MDRRGCMGHLFYLSSLALLPVVVYFLKNRYTTIELFGQQFNSMTTIFPVYFILTLVVILLGIRKPPRKE